MAVLTEIDDLAKQVLRKVAIADAGIKAVVNNRVFDIEQPKTKNPIYPSIHFDIDDGDHVVRNKDYGNFTLLVWAYSKKSHNEAKAAYNAFLNKFNCQRFSQTLANPATTVDIVLQEVQVAKKFTQTELRLFFYRATWEMRAIKHA